MSSSVVALELKGPELESTSKVLGVALGKTKSGQYGPLLISKTVQVKTKSERSGSDSLFPFSTELRDH